MVTVGLATHWPCVTDLVVHPPTGSTLKAHIREMSTLPKLTFGHGTPLPLYLYIDYAQLIAQFVFTYVYV